jgi:hypothetical protein
MPIHGNIIPTFEVPKNWKPKGMHPFEQPRKGSIPITLRQTGLERILGRQVLSISQYLGSYGMGGAGFFGLQLKKTKEYSMDWLVLRLWGADNWLHFDGHIINCHSNQVPKFTPLNSQELKKTIKGLTLVSAEVMDKSSYFILDGGPTQIHRLEIKEDPASRPLTGGSNEQHKFNPGESCWNAWVVSKTQHLVV